MKARIDKWGDNLAIQIPQSLASEVGLEADAEVELTAGDGELLISVRKGAKSRLERNVGLIDATDEEEDEALARWATEGRTDERVSREEVMAILRSADEG